MTTGGAGKLTALQLAQLAANAGFSGCDLPVAVAIALAESGGNPNEYNPESAAKGGTPSGKGSYGLWQIYTKVHPCWTPAQLVDPQSNANAAFAVYQAAGNTFKPWSTAWEFSGGKESVYLGAGAAFQKFMPVAQSVVACAGGGDTCSSGVSGDF